MFISFLSCSEKINPFENSGQTELVTDEFGFAAWDHGLRSLPGTFQIEVFDNFFGQHIKADCGFWGNTQLFVRIEDPDGNPRKATPIIVIWSVD